MSEIKNHPFFDGLDWETLRTMPAPYVPSVASDIDTRNFDRFDEDEPFYPPENDSSTSSGRRRDTDFIGYTFKKETQRDHLVTAL